MLEMRTECERCSADLPLEATTAYICSYECTFCDRCTEQMKSTCPNCGGVLEKRPTRVTS
jgi:hypothetical protein